MEKIINFFVRQQARHITEYPLIGFKPLSISKGKTFPTVLILTNWLVNFFRVIYTARWGEPSLQPSGLFIVYISKA